MNRRGFTLIELTIVIVIIGLIAAGIMAGTTMIRAARIRSVISEQESLVAGITTFRLKYACIPGDCGNATGFFGSAGGTGLITDNACVTPATSNRGDTGTCNGNGNGKIALSGGWGPGEGYERYLLWQHLSLAGLIVGKYAVSGAGISYGHQPNYNVPLTKLESIIWSIYRADDNAALAIGINDRYAPAIIGKNPFILGNAYYNAGGWWSSPSPFLSGPDARAIDEKYDDGMPFTGNITTMFLNYNNLCTTASDTSIETTPYRTSTSQVQFGCALTFPSGI